MRLTELATSGVGSRREFLAGAVLVLAVVGLLAQTDLWRPGKLLGIDENVQIAEAQAWWQGRLNLPERKWDTALHNEQAYNLFPPMFSILAAGVVPFFAGVPHPFMVLLAAVVPLLAYVLFQQRTKSVTWGVLLAIGFVCGTSAWPVLNTTVRKGLPYHVNHTLAVIGILLILIDCFGRQRIWLAAIGLFIAALSRQLTVAYALPLLLLGWYGTNVTQTQPRERAHPRRRTRRLAMALAGVLLPAFVYLGLNTLKFGQPLTTGYISNHDGRDDMFARDARAYGTLSTHWIPRNLYYTNLGFPDVDHVRVGHERRVYLKPNIGGTGIWWTTPLLLWLLLDTRRILADRMAAAMLASAGLVFAMLLLWYNTGAYQRGYNRYSLDYIAVLFALIAPSCVIGWRRWVTVGMIAWSVLYFRVILSWTHVQVWSSPIAG